MSSRKHVSLLQVDPLALILLRATGRCTVYLSEELFDMDGPGHYFRRIKTVAVSIPCVAGPYTSVNCTLTLLKSSIRKNSLLRDNNYAREGSEDDRFSDHLGSIQPIVTSTGQNDSGLFETNLRDERFLPFELSGVISKWQLELPAKVRQFDYDTISDVILHIRYTAREGGELLRQGAVTNLETKIKNAEAAGSVRLFSVRHEFPTEWAKFKASPEIEGDDEDRPFDAETPARALSILEPRSAHELKQIDVLAQGEEEFKITEKSDGTGKEDRVGAWEKGFLKGELKNTHAAPYSIKVVPFWSNLSSILPRKASQICG